MGWFNVVGIHVLLSLLSIWGFGPGTVSRLIFLHSAHAPFPGVYSTVHLTLLDFSHTFSHFAFFVALFTVITTLHCKHLYHVTRCIPHMHTSPQRAWRSGQRHVWVRSGYAVSGRGTAVLTNALRYASTTLDVALNSISLTQIRQGKKFVVFSDFVAVIQELKTRVSLNECMGKYCLWRGNTLMSDV